MGSKSLQNQVTAAYFSSRNYYSILHNYRTEAPREVMAVEKSRFSVGAL